MDKALQVRVRLDTSNADAGLRRLEQHIQRIQGAINNASNGTGNFTQAINNAVNATNQLNRSQNRVSQTTQQTTTQQSRLYNLIFNAARRTRDWYDNQRRVTAAARSTNNVLSSIGKKLKAIAATYLGIMGARGVINTADVITSAENKLNDVNGKMIEQNGGTAYTPSGGYTQDVFDQTTKSMDKMYVSAQKVRTGYADMMSNVSKSMTLASKAFQDNTNNAIRFQEIMAEAYAVGGASAAEQSSSMYQLMQALGSGILQGDELRSVREGAPLAYQAIEKFAQGVYKTDTALKELASDGKITSNMVVAAIMKAGNEMDKSFARTEQTFAQTWQQMKNIAVKAFEPVVKIMRKSLNEVIDNGFLEKLEKMFTSISKALQILVTVIGNAINWIASNWSWLKEVIIAGLIALGVYFVITKTIAIASAIVTAVAWAIVHWQLLLVCLAVFAIIYAFYLLQQGVIDTGTAIGIALLAVAAIMFLIFGWQVALIFAALALIVMFFDYVCGGVMFVLAVILDVLIMIGNAIFAIINFILALVVWCVMFVENIIIACVNACLQVVWSFCDPFLGIIEWILNACNGGFTSFGGAVANLIGQIISWFLSLGQVVTKIIDAIFGTNWTGGLNSLRDKVLAWGKKQDASITINRNAPELNRVSPTKEFKTNLSTLDYASLINPVDAYKSGKSWGSGVEDKLNDWGSGVANKVGNSLSLDGIGDKLGLNFDKGLFPNATDPTNSFLGSYKQPSADDLTGGLGKDVGKTAKNTGKMADSMELTQEDLEYLRRVADMEWKKEFTTANITVDMSNYNTITGENDLDGLVTKLTDMLYEELDSVANGVYV